MIFAVSAWPSRMSTATRSMSSSGIGACAAADSARSRSRYPSTSAWRRVAASHSKASIRALSAARSMQKSPVAKVMEAGLTALLQGREALKTEGPEDVGDFDLVDSVNRALERVKERETSNLRKGLAYLGTTASATPFIGLLGTVIGILGTFQLLRGGTVTINEIGPKISEALVSTALGLGVAIIAAMAFNFFTARVEQYVIDMNDVSSEFIDYVLREGRA